MYVCMYVCMYIYIYICTCVYLSLSDIYIYIYIYICAFTYLGGPEGGERHAAPAERDRGGGRGHAGPHHHGGARCFLFVC